MPHRRFALAPLLARALAREQAALRAAGVARAAGTRALDARHDFDTLLHAAPSGGWERLRARATMATYDARRREADALAEAAAASRQRSALERLREIEADSLRARERRREARRLDESNAARVRRFAEY